MANSIPASPLKGLIERIERLEEEKKTLTNDINEVYAEDKAFGFDTKIMRKVVKLRAMDAEERANEAELIALYMEALGMTPIEEAIERLKLRDAVKGMGEPVELTEEEKSKGGFAAFRHSDGTRATLSTGSKRSGKAAPQPSAQ